MSAWLCFICINKSDFLFFSLKSTCNVFSQPANSAPLPSKLKALERQIILLSITLIVLINSGLKGSKIPCQHLSSVYKIGKPDTLCPHSQSLTKTVCLHYPDVPSLFSNLLHQICHRPYSIAFPYLPKMPGKE